MKKYKHIRLMMGHKQAGVTQNYFKTKAPKMLKSYLKGVHRLTFLEEITVIDNTDDLLLELEKRNEERDEEMKQLRKDLDRALQLKGMESDLNDE